MSAVVQMELRIGAMVRSARPSDLSLGCAAEVLRIPPGKTDSTACRRVLQLDGA
jgi:hypothetical protein